jgi:hypothetical protein
MSSSTMVLLIETPIKETKTVLRKKCHINKGEEAITGEAHPSGKNSTITNNSIVLIRPKTKVLLVVIRILGITIDQSQQRWGVDTLMEVTIMDEGEVGVGWIRDTIMTTATIGGEEKKRISNTKGIWIKERICGFM